MKGHATQIGALAFAAVLWTPFTLTAQDSPGNLLAEANAAYRALRTAEAVKLYREYLARYDDRPDVRVFLGGALLNLDQLPAALDEAERAIALDPLYPKGYVLAGRIAGARRQWERAQDLFQKAKLLAPADLDAFYFSGRTFHDAGRFENAIEAFQQALRVGGEQSRVHENLGLAYEALGKIEFAEDALSKAVKLAGESSRPYIAYGGFLFRQSRLAESLPLLRQAMTLAPASSDARFELARVLYHAGEVAEAARVLEPAVPSADCRIHNLMVRIYFARGEAGLAQRQVVATENCIAKLVH
jgi:tetratricopeptide (TPR) repeat protein